MVWKVLTREELVNDVRVALGEPIIRVEVTDDQIKRNIDTALKIFWRYHEHGTVERYYAYTVTEDDVKNNYLPVPSNWDEVVEILPRSFSGSTGFTSAEWQLGAAASSPMTGSSMKFGTHHNPGGYFGGNEYISSWAGYNQITLSDWVISRNYLNLIGSLTGSEYKRFSFSKFERRIYPFFKYVEGEFIVMKVYETIDPDSGSVEAFDDDWLKDYIIALTKITWGNILRKYSGVALPGGVTIEGQVLVDEGTAEINALKEDVMNRQPIDFFIG